MSYQNKKRLWKETGTRFTPEYLEDVGEVASARDQSSSEVAALAKRLADFCEIGNTYGERSALKTLWGEIDGVVRRAPSSNGASEDVVRILQLVAHIIFFDNTGPLHRQLLSSAAKLPAPYLDAWKGSLARHIQRSCALDESAKRRETDGGQDPLGGCREVMRICKGVMSMQKNRLYDSIFEDNLSTLIESLGLSFTRICSYSRQGKVVSPVYIEYCQDAANVIYTLAQMHSPEQIGAREGTVAVMLRACLDCLQTDAMPRDVMITAAVTLWTYMFKGYDKGESGLPALWAANAVFASRPGAEGFSLGGGRGGEAEESRVHRSLGKGSGAASLEEELASLSDFGTLCCLRGLLSVLPTPSFGVTLKQKVTKEATQSEWRDWSLMLDGVLPKVKAAVNGAADSHTKYHALCILEIALKHWCQFLNHRIQVAATSPSAEMTEDALPCTMFDEGDWDGSEGHQDETEAAASAIEEDIPGAAAPAKDGMIGDLGMEAMLEVVDLLTTSWEAPVSQIVRTAQSCFGTILDIHEFQSYLLGEDQEVFVDKLCRHLLSMGFAKKGIYAPLGFIVKKVGSKKVLGISPNILNETLETARNVQDATCTAAADFLRVFLSKHYEECSSISAWREVWEPPLVRALQEKGDLMRQNISMYMLAIPLEIEPRSLYFMLTALLETMPPTGWSMEQVASVVVVLKTAKQLDLIGKIDQCVECADGLRVEIDHKIFQSALYSSQESVRINMLELLCTSVKKVVLPGKVELDLLRLAIPLNLTCTILGFKQRFETLMKRFFERIHIAIRSTKHKHLSDKLRKKPTRGSETAPDEEHLHELEMIRLNCDFLFWLRNYLVSCLYPGGTVARRSLSLNLLRILLYVFLNPQTDDEGAKAHETFAPLQEGPLVSSGTVQTLISYVAESWDDIRACAAEVLCLLPCPLAGLSAEADLERVLALAKDLLLSAQVRESDAGACLIRTLVKRYVLEMNWEVSIHPVVKVKRCERADCRATGTGSCEGYKSLLRTTLGLVKESIEKGKADLYKCCLSGLAHGGLLLMRYILEDMDKHGCLPNLEENLGMMREIFAYVTQATDLSVWAVSQQDELNVQAAEAEGDHSALADPAEGSAIAPMARVIINGSWLTIKEVSFASGKMAKILMSQNDQKEGDLAQDTTAALADLLRDLGDNLIDTLEKVKHNGSVEKAHLGLMSLVGPLLASSKEALNTLPYQWLERLRVFASRPGQTGSDIVRRSAGLPFALVALAKSEPKGLPKKLLPLGMETFLEMARGARGGEGKGAYATDGPTYFPRVHALNMVTKVLNDSELATDTSGFFADGLKLAITGFGDPHWEVRNGASQLYATLIVRMIGFKNIWRFEQSRRAITSSEFFDRFQILHAFFVSELHAAATELEKREEEEGSHGIVPATLVHPSLLPILGVLSRLECSLHNKHTASTDTLSPRRLAPHVQRCCVAQSLALRNMAADSFSSLIAPDETPKMWVHLVDKIKKSKQEEGANNLNVLHGTLRQLRVLMGRNASALREGDLKEMDKAVHSTYSLLVECASPSVACPFVRSEAAHLVNLMVTFVCEAKANAAQTQRAEEIWTEVATFAMGTAAMFSSSQDGAHAWEVAMSKLSVALLRQGKALGQPADHPLQRELREVTYACLSSSHYEVRASVLKEILRSWDRLVPEGPAIDLGVLCAKTRKVLESEPHHKVMKYVLALLQRFSLEDEVRSGWSAEDHLQVAAVSLTMAAHCTHEKIKTRALSCSGYFARLAVSRIESDPSIGVSGDFGAIMGCLVVTAADLSAPWQKVTSRLAALASLFESGLFREVAVDCPEDAPLDATRITLWRVAVDLLQDEDGEIRGKVGKLVGGALGTSDMSDLVLCAVFDHLTDRYCQSPLYWDFLVHLLDEASGGVWGGGARDGRRGPRETKRLFKREEDNLHVERFLLVQNALRQIQTILERKPTWEDGAEAGILEEYCGSAALEDLEGEDHEGGFLTTWCALMRVSLGGKADPRGSGALGRVLQGKLHPLISNLIHHIAPSREVREAIDQAYDPHFDPFFLIPPRRG